MARSPLSKELTTTMRGLDMRFSTASARTLARVAASVSARSDWICASAPASANVRCVSGPSTTKRHGWGQAMILRPDARGQCTLQYSVRHQVRLKFLDGAAGKNSVKKLHNWSPGSR